MVTKSRTEGSSSASSGCPPSRAAMPARMREALLSLAHCPVISDQPIGVRQTMRRIAMKASTWPLRLSRRSAPKSSACGPGGGPRVDRYVRAPYPKTTPRLLCDCQGVRRSARR